MVWYIVPDGNKKNQQDRPFNLKKEQEFLILMK